MARVLLAEDDHHISYILQLCLEKIGGHEVVVRQDGDSALETALRESFDLILLDEMMPKKTGLQVALELQGANHGSTTGTSNTPIVFLSAKSEEKDIQKFLEVGAGYIAKPFDPQQVCARIDEILRDWHERIGA